MKIVAMVPARLGSKRVPKKNLRYLGDKPLIFYIVETLKKVKEKGLIEEIYINSESEIFGRIANELDVKFYKRPEFLSTDSATNDEFAEDFLRNTDCTHLLQALPTSPFVSEHEICEFIEKMSLYDTVITVKNEQISCVYEGEPINFNPREKLPPSQEQIPVKSYGCVLMGWKKDRFLINMERDGCAYHNDYMTSIGYFSIEGNSTIDIDREEDFSLAEVVLESLKKNKNVPKYYGEENIEVDVESILKKDGIENNEFENSNIPISSLRKIINKYWYLKDWSYRIINTENNSATLICQSRGNGNRLHYHPDWNEWWYIVEGLWEYEIDGKLFKIEQGDIVFIEKGRWHKITSLMDKSMRLAISRSDVKHIYGKEISDV